MLVRFGIFVHQIIGKVVGRLHYECINAMLIGYRLNLVVALAMPLASPLSRIVVDSLEDQDDRGPRGSQLTHARAHARPTNPFPSYPG